MIATVTVKLICFVCYTTRLTVVQVEGSVHALEARVRVLVIEFSESQNWLEIFCVDSQCA